MKKLVRKIKAIFGIYEENVIYKVKLQDIVIPIDFQLKHPKVSKVLYKRDFYERNGHFPSSIILTKDHKLLDGYINYLILKEKNVKYAEVQFAKELK